MKKVGKTGVFLLAVIAALLCLAGKVAAAADSPLINEIYPNPTGADFDTFEWIEIYNPSGSPIDITSFSLKKSSSATAKNLSALICQTTDNVYFVCNLGTNWLVNSGAMITLLNNSSEIDKVTYESFDEQKGKSFSRIPNGSDTNDDEHDFLVLSPTQGSKNISPPPIIYSDQVIINEILPQPVGGSANEFIELFNFGATEVDLSGWKIDDIGEGGSSPYTIPSKTILQAGGFLVVYNSDDHISFNDNGDTARLIDPGGIEKSVLVYGQSKRGQSYSSDANIWAWSVTPTPGMPNMISAEEVVLEEEPSVPFLPIISAKNCEDGNIVKVEGFVSVVPNMLSSQYFYIQDDSGGIQIFSNSGNFPVLLHGQKIEVTGELTTAYGEKRIKILSKADIKIFADIQVLTPLEKDIKNIVEDDVGMLIQTIGTVAQTSGDTFVVEKDSRITVIIKNSTKIVKPKTKRGAAIKIVGILTSRFGAFRILPISQDGVTLLTSGLLPVTGADLAGDLNGIYIEESVRDWTIYFELGQADARRGFGLPAW